MRQFNPFIGCKVVILNYLNNKVTQVFEKINELVKLVLSKIRNSLFRQPSNILLKTVSYSWVNGNLSSDSNAPSLQDRLVFTISLYLSSTITLKLKTTSSSTLSLTQKQPIYPLNG